MSPDPNPCGIRWLHYSLRAMRNDDLPRICGAIEQHVADAFEMLELTADRVGERFAFLPYLNDPYEPGCGRGARGRGS